MDVLFISTVRHSTHDVLKSLKSRAFRESKILGQTDIIYAQVDSDRRFELSNIPGIIGIRKVLA